ncbi:hypothetical protein HX071_03335 [Myroides marinus]|uniref:hypothetical protein n=1 Tax=Myroides marinus TaxID=703342 RepID=UPI0025788F82|nr:hypothetical protein [Myroides marinus]MDM1501234.1 hypothetical protein [Myroides marinus]
MIVEYSIYDVPQGFKLSCTKEGVFLEVKLLAAELISFINSAIVCLVLDKSTKTICLEILDKRNDPFLIFHKFENSLRKHDIPIEVWSLIKETKFNLIVYNDNNYPICKMQVSKDNLINEFEDWVLSADNCFKCLFENIDFSDKLKTIFLDPVQSKTWEGNLIHNKEYFKLEEYFDDGNHGYIHEYSIRNLLQTIFLPNKNLFWSPKKIDGTELTDFLVFTSNVVLIIESKYVVSSKSTNFNKAIVKGVKQLRNTHKLIKSKQVLTTNNELNEMLQKVDVSIRICVFNDTSSYHIKKFKNVINTFDRTDLPIFVTSSFLGQLLWFLRIKYKEGVDVQFFRYIIKVYNDNRNEEIVIIDQL